MWDLDIIRKYAPIIYFDHKEPFYPVHVGVTILSQPAVSPSVHREFRFHDARLDYMIEYAIYWDFDIQHLYDLEHVWIYVAKDGSVLNCEASFHGKFFNGLLKDRSNLEETHVKLLCQPGKHAFSPILALFELLPNFDTCTDEDAGRDGLILTSPFTGTYETNDEINQLVYAYLQNYRFKPSMEFQRYIIPDDLYITWEILHQEVPLRIRRIVEHIRSTTGSFSDMNRKEL